MGSEVLVFCIGLFAGFMMWFLILPDSNQSDRWMRYDYKYDFGPEQDAGLHLHEEVHSLENKSVANQLFNEVRLLCFIITCPENHRTRAMHVRRTWGKRCNKILFMSSEKDDDLETIALPVKEGRNYLWWKTKEALKYIYENHFDDADWFLRAEDDSYVIVENLRYMLYPYPADEPLYFGSKFKPFVKQGFMSGGAGYVLSREALRRMFEFALHEPKICRSAKTGEEDIEIGKCLENVDVIACDSRDALGRGRFFTFTPEDHLIPGIMDKRKWYWSYIFYPEAKGFNCCSDNAISFHHISNHGMYVMDYLIYHLRPYGMVSYSQPLPPKKTLSEIMNSLTTISN